jgi:hypothetical protein
MENVMKKVRTLDEKALLKHNPKAAKVFEETKKKLEGRARRQPKEYSLGLPYARPALVSMMDDEEINSSDNNA